MYKISLVIVFILVLISLWAAFYNLLRKSDQSGRSTLKWLMLRVGLSVLLLIMVVYGLASGQLGWQGFGAN